eukprot:TRINITY_DN76636_c0_g1_i1.p1 TRINITY_DN76636_c0_g1~~TRINITY_DN76636_c0_g1_i1.p1  ORF type:complete len:285 (+),score=76.54 TRINITY_DN76636_c0_g1_i1:74-856(+)
MGKKKAAAVKSSPAAATGDDAVKKDEAASVKAPPPAEEVLSCGRVVRVGAEMQIANDYLDMQKVPDAEGLLNSGYLVLRRGEVVHVLYVGTAAAGDAGWVYGEVVRSLDPSRPASQRGWLPSKAFSLQSLAGLSPVASQSGTSRGADATPSSQKSSGTDGYASLSSTGASQKDVATTASRKAAAKAGASKSKHSTAEKKEKEGECAICSSGFGSARLCVQRPCCGKVICTTCDQKALSSGKCYFCRASNGDFPALSKVVR